MQVLVLEDNLMWSARLEKSLKSLGHVPVTWPTLKGELSGFDLAIVNLAPSVGDVVSTVRDLRAAGVYVVGHAGHKEKELHEVGRLAGCDRLATNSELTFKIESLLLEAESRSRD